MARGTVEILLLVAARVEVLLVYARDNDSHRRVVCRFASFLHACCLCTVHIDEWDAGELHRLGSTEWLLR